MQLEFRQWLINEGLWDATAAGWQAFKNELARPKIQTFEGQVDNIASATDALFAVDKFYKTIEPTLDNQTAKKLERRLEGAVRRLGFKVHPKMIFDFPLPKETKCPGDPNSKRK